MNHSSWYPCIPFSTNALRARWLKSRSGVGRRSPRRSPTYSRVTAKSVPGQSPRSMWTSEMTLRPATWPSGQRSRPSTSSSNTSSRIASADLRPRQAPLPLVGTNWAIVLAGSVSSYPHFLPLAQSRPRLDSHPDLARPRTPNSRAQCLEPRPPQAEAAPSVPPRDQPGRAWLIDGAAGCSSGPLSPRSIIHSPRR